MMEHANDFCYWIDDSLLKQSDLTFLDIENTNLISAMFYLEIGTNGTRGIAWSSWKSVAESSFRERSLGLKGTKLCNGSINDFPLEMKKIDLI